MDAASKLSPEERGTLLEGDAAFSEGHQELALEGQTDAHSGEKVNHHFIAFVNHNNTLYELDGRRLVPTVHGPSSDDTLLAVSI